MSREAFSAVPPCAQASDGLRLVLGVANTLLNHRNIPYRRMKGLH